MNRILATALLTLIPHALLEAQQSPALPTPRKPTAKELTMLRDGLTEMHRLDQLHRTPVSWGTTDKKELARLEALDDDAHIEEAKRRWREGIKLPKKVADELMAKQHVLDKANFQQLADWVRTFGYPNPERLGIDAPSPIGVLIHADNEWYDSIASLLRKEAKARRMDNKEFAALTDRKAQHAGRMQLYGMCRRFDAKSNKILPPEIEDIDKTNRARAELGLEPLKEYLIVTPKRGGSQQPANAPAGKAGGAK